MKNIQDYYTLSNGIKIPCVGFGTWQTPNGTIAIQSVLEALRNGYRHIDTAAVYGNEESVATAINQSNVDREDIFITTKLWNNAHGYEETKKAFELSMSKLDIDYLDLYLIHWPNPLKFRNEWKEKNAQTWRAMEELYLEGKIKAIGISNFRIHHIEALLETAKIIPMVNQIKLCPGENPVELISYCRDKKMLIEAYSPLGTGKIFTNETLVDIANKHKTSVSKIALKWSINNGYLPLPKSVTPKYIKANTDFFDIDLSDREMKIINELISSSGFSQDPDTANF